MKILVGWTWFVHQLHLARQRKRPTRFRSLRNVIRLEPLEQRTMFCMDVASILPGMSGSIHFVANIAHDELSGISVNGASVDDSNTNGGDLSDGIADPHHEHTEIPVAAGQLDDPDFSAPGSSGVFTAASLVFTTLANGMPILHSLLSAPTAIFLDFDGDSTTGTLAYDEDGNSSTFNATEQSHMAESWRQISTYFAMFDTDVTTILPSVPKAWLAAGNNIVGGYSYVGVFPNTYPRSFNNSGDVRTRSSGLTHELGHNFGLQHQSDYDLLGNKTAEYSSGFDTLHGPLMGVDFAQSVHKWFIGHPANSASSLQDDMTVIANRIKVYQGVGGDGFRVDDYGGTIATASALTSSGGSFSTSGIIERMSDVDAFSFTVSGGPMNVAAIPDSPSGVDIKLEIYASDGTLIAASDGATNYQQIARNFSAGTYYAFVSSHGNYGDVGTYNFAVNALPTGWTSQDIGSTGLVGSTQYDSSTGVFTVSGSGADISSTADAMQFAMQTLTGDGSITVRVASMMGGNASAKAGIEIRETTASNAKHVALTATNSSGLRFIRRTTTGGSSSSTSGTAAAFAPVWLRLTRTGNIFAAYSSSDGVSFTQLGTAQTVSMNATVQIGLVVTAQNNSALNTSTIDSLALTGNLGVSSPTPNALPAPSGVAVTQSTGAGLAVSWIDQAGETGYRVERSADGIVFTTAGTTAADVTTFDDPTLSGSMRYFYRIAALDATGASIPSSIISTLNRPSSVTNFSITSLDINKLVLNWRDTSGETGYRVERSTNNVSWTILTTVGVNIPSYLDSTVSVNTVYYYRLTPTSSLGDSLAMVASASTRLSAVTGQAFDSVASNQMVFHWTDIANETSYRVERSADGTTFTTLATVGANVTTYTDNGVTPVNEYYYRVIGVNSLTEGVKPAAIFAASPSVNTLPVPWASSDIGAVKGPGTTDYSAGSFKVISNGIDIWGTADAFRYTYQTLAGNGSITTRVAAVEDTGGWAKVGVMVRETLNANSKQAMVMVTPGNGVDLQYRTSTGGSSTSVAGPVVTAPEWVRLTRTGNLLEAFASPDGVVWTSFGSITISMANTVYFGLAADSSTTTTLNTSTFDSVSVVNTSPPTVATAAAATPSIVTGTTTALSVLGADDQSEVGLTYTWSTSSLPAGAGNPIFNINSTNLAKNTIATFSKAGSYTFTVTITDTGNLSTTTNVNVIVNQTLSSMALTPQSVTLNANQTQLFVASGFDQFAIAMVTPPTFAWSVSAGIGSVNSSGLYTAPNAGGNATVSASAGSVSTNASLTINIPAATLYRSYIFYNDSAYETVGGVNGAIDDPTINLGASKTVRQSSEATQDTTIANISNYSKGINGLVFDVNSLASNSLAASDFLFRRPSGLVSGLVNPSTWNGVVPAPTVISVTPGAPSRIRIEWADNAIQNTWLQIIVKANAHTGLTSPVVLYVGHALGDVSGTVPYRVNNSDLAAIQPFISASPVSITDPRDVNKDRKVNNQDLNFVQLKISATTLLNNITIPIAGSANEGSGPGFGSLFLANEGQVLASTNSVPMVTTDTTPNLTPVMSLSVTPTSTASITSSRTIGNAPASSIPITMERSMRVSIDTSKSSRQSIDDFFAELGNKKALGTVMVIE